MPMLRSLAFAMAAGILAGLPVTGAQACDNDRYPCPVVAQTQDAATATVSAQSRKKARRATRQDEAAGAKPKRQSSPTSARMKAAAPSGQERSADASDKKAADPARALNEVDRNESPVAAAAAAWLVLPSAAGAVPQTAAGEAESPAVARSDVQIVDPNEMNELDRAAASALLSESSWFNYLLMTLGAALAAASAVRFLLV
jgi:hypothetical protein